MLFTYQFLQLHSELCTAAAEASRGARGTQWQKYMAHVGNVRRATWCWSFECGRYFGERGAIYAKTQAVPLVPKKMRDASLHENQVEVFWMEEGLAKVE